MKQSGVFQSYIRENLIMTEALYAYCLYVNTDAYTSDQNRLHRISRDCISYILDQKMATYEFKNVFESFIKGRYVGFFFSIKISNKTLGQCYIFC